jgi:hypothetical protein
MSRSFHKPKKRIALSVPAAIKRLRAAAETMNASSSRYGANDFLVEIYRIHWDWWKHECLADCIEQLNRRFGLHRRKPQKAFKTIFVAAKWFA